MPPNPNRRNSRNEAHDVFMQFHRHRAQSIKALDLKMSESKLPKPVQPFDMFHTVMKTGVIYATSRAGKFGFHAEAKGWANMGQGAPETGPLPGAPARDCMYNTYNTIQHLLCAGVTDGERLPNNTPPQVYLSATMPLADAQKALPIVIEALDTRRERCNEYAKAKRAEREEEKAAAGEANDLTTEQLNSALGLVQDLLNKFILCGESKLSGLESSGSVYPNDLRSSGLKQEGLQFSDRHKVSINLCSALVVEGGKQVPHAQPCEQHLRFASQGADDKTVNWLLVGRESEGKLIKAQRFIFVDPSGKAPKDIIRFHCATSVAGVDAAIERSNGKAVSITVPFCPPTTRKAAKWLEKNLQNVVNGKIGPEIPNHVESDSWKPGNASSYEHSVVTMTLMIDVVPAVKNGELFYCLQMANDLSSRILSSPNESFALDVRKYWKNESSGAKARLAVAQKKRKEKKKKVAAKKGKKKVKHALKSPPEKTSTKRSDSPNDVAAFPADSKPLAKKQKTANKKTANEALEPSPFFQPVARKKKFSNAGADAKPPAMPSASPKASDAKAKPPTPSSGRPAPPAAAAIATNAKPPAVSSASHPAPPAAAANAKKPKKIHPLFRK